MKIIPDRNKQIIAINHTSIANIKMDIHNRKGMAFRPITLKQKDSLRAIPEKQAQRNPIGSQINCSLSIVMSKIKPIHAAQVIISLTFLS